MKYQYFLNLDIDYEAVHALKIDPCNQNNSFQMWLRNVGSLSLTIA